MPTVPKQRQKPTLRDIETAALLMRGKILAYDAVFKAASRQQDLARAAGQYDAADAFFKVYLRYARKSGIAHRAMLRLALTYSRRAAAANPKTAMAKFDTLWARLEWAPAGKAAE